MAVQTRVLIESKDILGVEFECPHCAATILYSLDRPSQRIASQCPNCNENWFAALGANAHPSTPTVAKQVLEALAAFQALLKRPDINARIRLQINGLPKE